MAENPITDKDLYSGDGKPFEAVIKNLIALETKAEETIKRMLELGKALKASGTANDSQSLKEQISLMKEFEKEQKKLAEVEKIRAKAELDLAKAQSDRIKADKIAKENTEKLIDQEEKELGTIQKLRKESKELRKEKEKLNLETDNGRKRLEQINTRLDENSQALKRLGTQQSKMMDSYFTLGEKLRNFGTKLTGLLGIIGGGAVVFQGFQKVMQSTEAIGDEFGFFVDGLKGGFESLFKSVANLDFTNLIDNFGRAFTAGREFSKALDEIEDKMRGLRIQSAEVRKQQAELEILFKSAIPETEKIEAIDKFLKKEEELANAQIEISKATLFERKKAFAAENDIDIKQIDNYIELLKNAENYAQGITEINKAREKSEKLTREARTNEEQIKAVDAAYKALQTTQKFKRESELIASKLLVENSLSAEQIELLITDIEKLAESEASYLEDNVKKHAKRSQLIDQMREASLKKEKEVLKESTDANKRFTEGMAEYTAEQIRLQDEVAMAAINARKEQQLAIEQDLEAFEQLSSEDFDKNYISPIEQQISEHSDFKKMERKRDMAETQELWAQKLNSVKTYADGAVDVIDSISNFQQAKMNRELAAVGDNQAAQDAIRKKYARKEQQQAVNKAIINGALAVGNALTSTPFPLPALIFAAIATAKAASEVALIKSVKFAKGGSWIEGGKLHSQGGNKYGDKELERGEMVSVFSRKATSKHADTIQSFTNAVNADRPELALPELKPQMFSEFSKLLQINTMLLNEQKSLNSHLKNQYRQVGVGRYIDGHGNKINMV